jgi:hypothetical protein
LKLFFESSLLFYLEKCITKEGDILRREISKISISGMIQKTSGLSTKYIIPFVHREEAQQHLSEFQEVLAHPKTFGNNFKK